MRNHRIQIDRGCATTPLKILVYFIVFVCIYDIYLSIRNYEVLYDHETNFFAKSLIDEKEIITTHMDQHGYFVVNKSYEYDVSKLVLYKMLGLVCAVHILYWILHHKFGWIIIPIVAIGHFFLLLHLLT